MPNPLKSLLRWSSTDFRRDHKLPPPPDSIISKLYYALTSKPYQPWLAFILKFITRKTLTCSGAHTQSLTLLRCSGREQLKVSNPGYQTRNYEGYETARRFCTPDSWETLQGLSATLDGIMQQQQHTGNEKQASIRSHIHSGTFYYLTKQINSTQMFIYIYMHDI